MIPGGQRVSPPAARVHHPSCARPAAGGCLCPPLRGQVVRLEGMPGRWRVLRADLGRVLLGRAREVKVLTGEDLRLVRAEG